MQFSIILTDTSERVLESGRIRLVVEKSVEIAVERCDVADTRFETTVELRDAGFVLLLQLLQRQDKLVGSDEDGGATPLDGVIHRFESLDGSKRQVLGLVKDYHRLLSVEASLRIEPNVQQGKPTADSLACHLPSSSLCHLVDKVVHSVELMACNNEDAVRELLFKAFHCVRLPGTALANQDTGRTGG